MLEMWVSHPDYFITLAVVFICILIVIVIGILRNRPYRHKERMKAMELNNVDEAFFAARLLMYVPWQFWTSLVILIIVIAASVLSTEEASKAFVELSKYVTGAVIGSLFGSAQKQGNRQVDQHGTADN
jgi:hypothetical protein